MASEATQRYTPQSPFSTPSHSESDDASSSDSRHIGSSKKVITERQQADRKRREQPEQDSGKEEDDKSGPSSPPAKRKKEDDPLLTRTGGAYIPPARLRMMQQQVTDKSSEAYQRLSWEALKKSIHGLINKVNVANISMIVREILMENIIRGRGLVARSVIQAQSFSPSFTNVYAALVAIVNTKFPNVGELIIHRLLSNFKKGYRRNDKRLCLSAVQFVAHLVNQNVLHEVAALEILAVLLEDANDDTVEVAVGFLKECGAKLTEVAGRAVMGVFDTLRQILHEGKIEMRTQYMIEVLQAVRKDKYKEYPTVVEGLDLVEEEDQCTHMVGMDDELDPQDRLDVFRFDPDFLANEEKYRQLRAEILGESSGSEGGSSGEVSDTEESEDEQRTLEIQDETQMNVMALRRTIYLTIMSSLDFEECAHKLLKMKMKEGHEYELCSMIIECCSQERSFKKFFGLLGQRFCMLNKVYVEQYDRLFQEHYATVHRLDTVKIRNVAKFFAHLLYSDAIPWTTMACIQLNEDETNSSSRIYIKILFQELAEYMGLVKLNERLNDPFLQPAFEGLMPRDNPRDTRFSINFFTSIGLGGLTDSLREHLKNAPKMIMEQTQDVESSDSSSSDSEDSSSESESESSEEEPKKKGRRKWPEPLTKKGLDLHSKVRGSPERSRHRNRWAESPEDVPDRMERRERRRGETPEESSPGRVQRRGRRKAENDKESPDRSQLRERRRVRSPEESSGRAQRRERRAETPEESSGRTRGRERQKAESEEDSPDRSQHRRRRKGGSPEGLPDRPRHKERRRVETQEVPSSGRAERRERRKAEIDEESPDRSQRRERRRVRSPEESSGRAQHSGGRAESSEETSSRVHRRGRRKAETDEESPDRSQRRERRRPRSPEESSGRAQRSGRRAETPEESSSSRVQHRERRKVESPEDLPDRPHRRENRRVESPDESLNSAHHKDRRTLKTQSHHRADPPEEAPSRYQRRDGRRRDSPVGRSSSRRSGSRDVDSERVGLAQQKRKERLRDEVEARRSEDSGSEMEDEREAVTKHQEARGRSGGRDNSQDKEYGSRRDGDRKKKDEHEDHKRDRYYRGDERERDCHDDVKKGRDYRGNSSHQRDVRNEDRKPRDYHGDRESRKDLSRRGDGSDNQRVERHYHKRSPARERRRRRRVTSSSSSNSDSSDIEEMMLDVKAMKRDNRRDRDRHRDRRREYSSGEERDRRRRT